MKKTNNKNSGRKPRKNRPNLTSGRKNAKGAFGKGGKK